MNIINEIEDLEGIIMKQRIISAIVALIIVIPLFLLGGIPYKVGVGLIAALAFKEIIDLKENKKIPAFIKIIAFICYEIIVYNNLNASYIYNEVSFAILGITALLLIIPSIFIQNDNYTTHKAFSLLGCTITIGIFFNLLIIIREANAWLLLYLILIAIMTDTFAMLIGCLIGRHKLIPKVSPKKSVEGSIAGSLLGTVIASLYYYNVIPHNLSLTSLSYYNIMPININITSLVIMSLVLTILGQLGDLFFSKIKRENEIKDFSNIMPGHGGILDRLDSLTFIVYGYIIIINILKIFK